MHFKTLRGSSKEPTSIGEGYETFIVRVWKPLLEREMHFKTLRGSSEEPTSIGEGYETFIIRVWKPLLKS